MTEERKSEGKLDRLAEALIEETLAMSDEDMLADPGEDAEEKEPALRSEISLAIANHRRQLLIAARNAVQGRRVRPKRDRRSPNELRAAINNAIARPTNDDSPLTLAAREGRDVPDADLEGLAEDLSELGFNVDGEHDPDAS